MQGCTGIQNKNQPCPHLESIISKGNKPNREVYWEHVEWAPDTPRGPREQEVVNLFFKLKRNGLNDLEASVLICRTVYKWTLAETCEFLHMEDRFRVNRIFKDAVAMVKKGLTNE